MYHRLGEAIRERREVHPDFALAVKRHRLLDALQLVRPRVASARIVKSNHDDDSTRRRFLEVTLALMAERTSTMRGRQVGSCNTASGRDLILTRASFSVT